MAQREMEGSQRGCLKLDIAVDVKTKKNASALAKALPSWKKCAGELQALGYEKWNEQHEYGKRRAVEGVFSFVKRIFGENVRVQSQTPAVREVKRKFLIYNMLQDMGI